MAFNEFLKTRFEKLGKTQLVCAKAIGCSEASLSEWLSGKKQPSRRYLEPLAKLISVDVKELLKKLN